MSKKSPKEKSGDITVEIGGVVDLLHKHLSGALCSRAFHKERTNERQRQWTLFNLVKFWTAVILKAPPSLTQALEECRAGKSGMFPAVAAAPEAFFQRCRDMKPVFFADVYKKFVRSVLPEAPCAYASELSGLRERFSNVWVIDGSRLDKIAHRLKILRNVKETVLPGCLIACYDIFKGIAPVVHVSTNGTESEHSRAETIIEDVPKRTLLVGDALFCTLKFIRLLAANDIYGLFRRNRTLTVKKIGPTPGRKKGRGQPKDDLILIGSGINHPKITVRRIKVPGFELYTTVLDPKQLSAEEALKLYKVRWQVERLFYDIKEVLNLNRFYTSSPRSIVMQVYATALVHTAMRIAQAKVADKAGIEPELLSPQKLFPRVAAASVHRVESELTYIWIQKHNSGTKIIEPDWRELPSARVRLNSILVEHRRGKRRKRKYSPRRTTCLSFNKIRGGRKLS